MRPVKTLASLLTCLIVLHATCMARCVGEGSRMAPPSAVPPCHHSQETPDHNNVPMPVNTCLGGPALEAKSPPTLKCVLDIAAPSGSLPALVMTSDTPFHATAMERPTILPPLLLRSVLRI